jgi:hypothetical protein
MAVHLRGCSDLHFELDDVTVLAVVKTGVAHTLEQKKIYRAYVEDAWRRQIASTCEPNALEVRIKLTDKATICLRKDSALLCDGKEVPLSQEMRKFAYDVLTDSAFCEDDLQPCISVPCDPVELTADVRDELEDFLSYE